MLTTYTALHDCDALVQDLRSIRVGPPSASGGLRLQIAASAPASPD
jgi:hypothetical protein